MVTLDTRLAASAPPHARGVLDAIAARVDPARAQPIDPLECRQRLLDDELARRDTEGSARRERLARFEEVVDRRDVDFSA